MESSCLSGFHQCDSSQTIHCDPASVPCPLYPQSHEVRKCQSGSEYLPVPRASDKQSESRQRPSYSDQNTKPNLQATEASHLPTTAAAGIEQSKQQSLEDATASVKVDETDLEMQERLWHLKAARPPYRRGGGRGAGPYRGAARYGYYPPTRPDNYVPCFRGKGRIGRGGGRRSMQPLSAVNMASSASPNPGTVSAQQQPQLSAPLAASAIVPLLKPARGPRPPPQVFWCEICMVECNTLEILEQHKSGKRHQKTLRRYEELQKLKKAAQGMDALQPEIFHGANEKEPENENRSFKESALESSISVASIVGGNMNLEEQSHQPNVAQVDPPATLPEKPNVAQVDPANLPEKPNFAQVGPANLPEKPNVAQLDPANLSERPNVAQLDPATLPGKKRKLENKFRYSSKRKTKYGRGDKHLRQSESLPTPEVPKEIQTRYCSVCNVTCDTQAVFEAHLGGKKHASRLRKYTALQGSYGIKNQNPNPFSMPQLQGEIYPFYPQERPFDGGMNHYAQHTTLETQVQGGFEYQGLGNTSKESGDNMVGAITTQDHFPPPENSITGLGHTYMQPLDAFPASGCVVPFANDATLPGLTHDPSKGLNWFCSHLSSRED